MADADFKVGLLGHGTVGGAFAELLAERAAEIERFNGRRPVISGVLTRTRGDFQEIVSASDLIVELIGGIEPAREYVLALQSAGAERGLVAFVALPVRLAVATLDRLEQAGPGSKLTRPEVYAIVQRMNRALDHGEPAVA